MSSLQNGHRRFMKHYRRDHMYNYHIYMILKSSYGRLTYHKAIYSVKLDNSYLSLLQIHFPRKSRFHSDIWSVNIASLFLSFKTFLLPPLDITFSSANVLSLSARNYLWFSFLSSCGRGQILDALSLEKSRTDVFIFPWVIVGYVWVLPAFVQIRSDLLLRDQDENSQMRRFSVFD